MPRALGVAALLLTCLLLYLALATPREHLVLLQRAVGGTALDGVAPAAAARGEGEHLPRVQPNNTSTAPAPEPAAAGAPQLAPAAAPVLELAPAHAQPPEQQQTASPPAAPPRTSQQPGQGGLSGYLRAHGVQPGTTVLLAAGTGGGPYGAAILNAHLATPLRDELALLIVCMDDACAELCAAHGMLCYTDGLEEDDEGMSVGSIKFQLLELLDSGARARCCLATPSALPPPAVRQVDARCPARRLPHARVRFGRCVGARPLC